MTSREQLIKTLMITAEVFDKKFSPEAAAMLVNDLSTYPPHKVMGAIDRCRKELTRFPVLAQIIERIDDGHPGKEEAWAMMPKNEDDSVCWTTLMAQAYGTVYQLMRTDMIAARMAFLETYNKLAMAAKIQGEQPQWMVSFGHDTKGRESAVVQAMDKGRITNEQAISFLGYDPSSHNSEKQLSYSDVIKKISDKASQ